jgi:NAD-dependent deacetylase
MTPVDRAREIIDNARRLVVFTGAGVSADSGVPTFRGSSGDSFWGKYDPMQLASPQGFSADPRLVYDWYNWRRGQLATVQPNPAHHAIAALQQHGGAVVITQNVDGLHERVAPTGATVLRLHGTIAADSARIHTATTPRHRRREPAGTPAVPAVRRPAGRKGSAALAQASGRLVW